MSSGCCINSVVVPDHQPSPAGTIRADHQGFFLLGETLVGSHLTVLAIKFKFELLKVVGAGSYCITTNHITSIHRC